MRRSVIAAVTVGTALAMALAACGGSSGASSPTGATTTPPTAGSPGTSTGTGTTGPEATTQTQNADYASGKTFTTDIGQDPGNLNPLVTNIVAAQIVGAWAYDSLVFFDPKTGAASPYLAEKWTEAPNKVTFTLKKGITCSDGEAFTAQTAADNFEYIIDPKNQSPLLGSIVPANAKVSVDAATNTMTLETPGPSPFLLYLIGSQALMCEKGIKNPDSVKSASDGTGLYTITADVPNDHINLQLRQGVTWAPGGVTSTTPGLPANVTIKVITNVSTSANLLLTGGLNASEITGPDEARVKKFTSFGSPNLSAELLINQYKTLPTADVKVRQALVQAVNWEDFNKISTSGQGSMATGLDALAPPVCTYDSMSGNIPTFDTAAAAKTLDDDGWTMGSDGVRQKDGHPLELTFIYVNTNPQLSAAVEYVQKQWTALGVKTTLKGGDVNFALGATVSAKDLSSWGVSIGINFQSNIPSLFPSYLSGPTPPNGSNFMSIDNPGYNAKVAKAQVLSGAAACDAWKAAEVELWNQMDIFPIGVQQFNMYFNGATTLYQPNAGALVAAGVRMLK